MRSPLGLEWLIRLRASSSFSFRVRLAVSFTRKRSRDSGSTVARADAGGASSRAGVVCAREPTRKPFLGLSHARAGDAGEQLSVALVGQIGFEKREHGQRNASRLQERKDSRKSAQKAGALDAPIRFVLAEMKELEAVAE